MGKNDKVEKNIFSEETTEKVKTISTVPKMGLVRFLQIKPQKRGIEAVLKRKYSTDVKTLEEWDVILFECVNRKIL